ncbi:hypothetical protein PIB30_067623 [Stylosanthes scabra]|uniref:Uncharacterized protein n=1 Tax=Stylosanthes scabra TaxID=79078 RepID=A0ABU6ULL8_9FABA|nr:hypothetical protein [Stylosanthes scabra]
MGKRGANKSIEDVDELQANNDVYLKNFNLFENKNGPTTPGSQDPPSSTPSVSNITSIREGRYRRPRDADLIDD